MNILMLPSWYESEEESGSGSFFTEQALALKKWGNSVVIAIADIINYPYKTRAPKYKIIEEVRHGIKVYRIKVPSLMTGHFPKLFFKYYAHYYFKLYKYMQKKGLRFDLLYAHSFWHAGYIATALKQKCHIPLFVQEHRSMLLSGEFTDKINKFLLETVMKADRFYCVSNRLKENIEKRTNTKDIVKILPNMVSEGFGFQDIDLNSRNKFVFTFIGTLNENKRIMQLLQCFADEFGEASNVMLRIVGNGPLCNEVKDFSDKSFLSRDKVEFLGYVDREKIPDVLAQTNVFVLPSKVETFGVVYIEALAIGRPVVGTFNGGADDIITHENGIIVECDDNSALRAALRQIYSEYNNYNLKKISDDCLAKYSQDSIISRLIEDINDVLNSK